PPRRLARVRRQGREVMRCASVRKELTALIDGALAPRLTAKVRLHLDRCPACRAELGTIERTVRLERAVLPSALPDLSLGFRTRLRQRLAEVEALPGRWSWAAWAWKPMLAGGVAVAAVL